MTIMGNIFTSFFSRRQEMSPDQALQILLDALNAQRHAQPDGSAPAEQNTVRPLSFEEWCRRLELPRQKLDRHLRKELGCSGQEWVTALQDKRTY